MSVSVMLSQFEALVTKMELVGSRLCNKRIRPTADQLNDFQILHTRFKDTLANFDDGIQKLLAFGSPAAEDLQLADRIRAAKDPVPITSSISTAFKRNLILIFMGPKTFELDSRQVKMRNKQTESRCKVLRSQHSHVVLMWAMSLQPSIWKTSVGMNDKTFDFLIGDLSDERMNQIPPRIFEIILSLAGEESMSVSDTFASFAEDVSKDAAELQPNLKRRRTSGIELHSNVPEARGHRVSSANTESHMEQQHTSNSITKIQQNRQIDYRCSASPIKNLPILGDKLFDAVQSSHQWQWERTVGGTETSDCVNALVPKSRTQDISINLLVGHENGLQLIYELEAIRV